MSKLCYFVVFVAAIAAGCAEDTGRDSRAVDLGHGLLGAVVGDKIVVEGDIVIGDATLLETAEGLNVLEQKARVYGRARRWPDATVPFTINNTVNGGFTTAQQNAIRDAMDEIAGGVPGLTFVAYESAEHGSWIDFISSANCQSSVGRQGGRQTVELAPGCTGNFSVHHEIIHALGYFHEHTRKDRDANVQINWGSIEGCPANATGASSCGNCNAGACGCTQANCNRAGNFVTNQQRSDVYEYDFDSVMHYGLNAFSSTGADTMTVVAGTSVTTVGQRNHLSEGDLRKLRVAYPVPLLQTTHFQSQNSTEVCIQYGREEDLATLWTISGWPLALNRNVSANTVIAPGDYNVTCRGQSAFWEGVYDYPNSQWGPPYPFVDGDEDFTLTATVRILNAGLIPTILAL